MSKKLLNKKIIISVFCIIVVVAIVLGVVFLANPAEYKFERYSYVAKEQNAVAYGDSFENVLNCGDAFLSVDATTSAIAMGVGSNIFNSFSVGAAEKGLANVIDVVLRDENNNQYVMNSTDNSVNIGTFSLLNEDNKLRLDFALYATKKESEKGESADVWVKLPVEFFVENGGFKVSVDLSAVSCAEGLLIESISILPGLFSVDIPSENMKYYIPEGCGAEIQLDTVTEEDFSQALSLYGSDASLFEYSSGAVLPCFAFSNGNALVSVMIDEGDALSEISVVRDKTGCSKLYNTYNVTTFGVSDGRPLKGSSYDGAISQIYHITNGKNADYNTLTQLTRDFLVTKKYIPSQLSDKFSDLPFLITVIGSENGKSETTYTSFENGAEIVALLKSRGVRSVALRFAGGGDKGLSSVLWSSKEINDGLGGKKKYSELCNIAVENNSSVWYDLNLATDASTKATKSLDVYSKIRAYLGKDAVNSKLLSYFSVDSNISSVYKLMSEFENSNFCLNDLSFLLYTDIDGKVDRQAALDRIRNNTEVLSLGGGLMLESPAVYLMNNADAVFSMPEKTSYESVKGVTSVPILQMVLHGSICYGTQPVNLSQNADDAVLKAVEYGASPSFVFTHNNCDALDYGPYASQTAKYYSKVKKMMPLMDMKITSHQKVVSGVYKVTYDYSKIVYVNYNPSVVEVNGILISAKDFVII